jgi:hypothetical protein
MMPITHSRVNKTLGQYPRNEQYNRKGEEFRPDLLRNELEAVS